MRTITLFFLCLMAWVPVIAQLDTTFFYGSLLAARGGQVVFTQYHGWANIAAGVPNRETTNFELASLSKVFTAVAVVSSTQDLYRFDQALFSGRLLHNLDTMFNPVVLPNGELTMAGKYHFG